MVPSRPESISAANRREGRSKVKSIKMFGLASLAALMAMAFVGVTSAMATDPTALCDTDPGTGAHETCPATHLVSHVHETTLSGAKGKLVTSFLTIECDVLFLGDVLTANNLAAAGSQLVLSGNFTYSNCGSCKVTEENGPVEIKVLKTAAELAEVTGKGLVHVVCGSSLDCSYVGTGLKGHGLGPLPSGETNGDVSIVDAVTEKEAGGFLCPKSSKLTITTTPLTVETSITE
jgi:hypothetical protein